jgi:acid phosphatase
MKLVRVLCGLGGALCLAAACTAPPSAAPPPSSVASSVVSSAPDVSVVPRPDHVVVVVEENRSYSDVIGRAPYLDSLAGEGALFTSSYAVAHPSEPNYLALFSGSTQGLTDDSCPHTFTGGNLGAQLRAAGLGFAGYSEGLPATGFLGCSAGDYARKHNPWADFPNVPASANLPWTAFPHDYAALPTVSFVIPDLAHDMHDGTIGDADSWLRANLSGYVDWARSHRSLLIVTWDEDDYSQANRIPTIIVGAAVKPGHYTERIDHDTVLRTLETAYGLAPLGAAASTGPITDCWRT